MSKSQSKQLVLKPQDLLVTLKIAINEDRRLTFATLAHELSMSASEVYAASQRAEASRLLGREDGQLYAIRPSLQEFVLHGVKYSFPGQTGAVVRGMATSTAAPPLNAHFAQSDLFISVWPDPKGSTRGVSLIPIYPSVPFAARTDPMLYEVLALIDAMRIGGARERELASSELTRRLL
jgi:hypothetical protein